MIYNTYAKNGLNNGYTLNLYTTKLIVVVVIITLPFLIKNKKQNQSKKAKCQKISPKTKQKWLKNKILFLNKWGTTIATCGVVGKPGARGGVKYLAICNALSHLFCCLGRDVVLLHEMALENQLYYEHWGWLEHG